MMLIKGLLLVLTIILHQASPSLIEKLKVSKDIPEITLTKWDLAEEEFMEKSKHLISTLSSNLDAVYDCNVTISSECTNSLMETLDALKSYKLWAYSMLDASGKFSSGVLSLSTSDFGSYEQCIGISIPNANEKLFDGKYCLLELTLPFSAQPFNTKVGHKYNMLNHTFKTEVFEHVKKYPSYILNSSLKLGICLPSLCTEKDLDVIANQVLQGSQISAKTIKCEVAEEKNVSISQFTIMIVFSTLIGLVTLATMITQCPKCNKEEKPKKKIICLEVARAFCVVTNCKRLFESKDKSPISFLHGLKVLSVVWLIAANTLKAFDSNTIRSLTESDSILRTLPMQPLLNAFLPVDIIIFISAVVLSYTTFTMVEENGMSVHKPVTTVVHRMMRLIPSSIMILGAGLLIPLLYRGPNWSTWFSNYSDLLKNSCWFTLLSPRNDLVTSELKPLPHFWYMAVDIQLVLVAVVFFVLYFRNAKIGHIFLYTLIPVSVISTGVMMFLFDVPAISADVFVNERDYAKMVNLNSFATVHLSVFVLGILTGLFIFKRNNVKIPVTCRAVSWLLAVGFNLASVYGIYCWSRGAPVSVYGRIIYGSLHRTVLGFGLCWLSIACANGYGCMISKFLSWKALVPLSKLTYIAFLIHYFVSVAFNSHFQGQINLTTPFLAYAVIGNIVVSFGLALFGYLLFDGPWTKILNLIPRTCPYQCPMKKSSEEQYRKFNTCVFFKNRKENVLPDTNM